MPKQRSGSVSGLPPAWRPDGCCICVASSGREKPPLYAAYCEAWDTTVASRARVILCLNLTRFRAYTCIILISIGSRTDQNGRAQAFANTSIRTPSAWSNGRSGRGTISPRRIWKCAWYSRATRVAPRSSLFRRPAHPGSLCCPLRRRRRGAGPRQPDLAGP